MRGQLAQTGHCVCKYMQLEHEHVEAVDFLSEIDGFFFVIDKNFIFTKTYVRLYNIYCRVIIAKKGADQWTVCL